MVKSLWKLISVCLILRKLSGSRDESRKAGLHPRETCFQNNGDWDSQRM